MSNLQQSQEEIWKDIDGFDNYEISNHGFVKSKQRKVVREHYLISVREKILKNSVHSNRMYHTVRLYPDNGKSKLFFLHRLIAIAFIENPNNYNVVNHIDGNTFNNAVSNLEWCTQLHNIRHAYRIGLSDNSNLKNGKARTIKDINTGELGCVRYFAKKFNKHSQTIGRWVKLNYRVTELK